MRSWAVWNRGLRLGISLAIFLALCWMPSIPIILIFNRSLECRGLSYVLHTPGSDSPVYCRHTIRIASHTIRITATSWLSDDKRIQYCLRLLGLIARERVW